MNLVKSFWSSGSEYTPRWYRKCRKALEKNPIVKKVELHKNDELVWIVSFVLKPEKRILTAKIYLKNFPKEPPKVFFTDPKPYHVHVDSKSGWYRPLFMLPNEWNIGKGGIIDFVEKSKRGKSYYKDIGYILEYFNHTWEKHETVCRNDISDVLKKSAEIYHSIKSKSVEECPKLDTESEEVEGEV